MEISNYIKELLFLNDCVILPGFGGFITKYKPAEIDEKQLSFIPPSKQIVFNPQLLHNDGLFINYVSVVNKVSYNDAKNIVSDFVGNIHIELWKNNCVCFNEIGSFKLDEQQNICFEADSLSNLLTDSFGLSSFHFPEIDLLDVQKTFEEKIRERTGIRSIIRHPLTKAAMIAIPVIAGLTFLTLKTNVFQTLKDKYYAVNTLIADTINDFRKYTLDSNNYVGSSLSIMTIKSVALDYTEPVKNISKIEDQTTTVKGLLSDSINILIPEKEILAATEEIAPKKDDLKKIQETVKFEKNTEIKNQALKKEVESIKQKDKKTIEKNDVVKNTAASSNKYYLVAGSFGNADNARAFSKQISEKGYSAEILHPANGLYRVVLKSFSDRNIASKELADINKKNTDFTVWIMSPK